MIWLTLLLAFQQALWIDVPFVQQDKNGCGSAVIWMVMKYWKDDGVADVAEIQRQLYSPQAGGIYAKDMTRYFESHGYRVFTFRGEWADLSAHVAKGRPLIVSLERNSRGVPLHYVVVAGIDPANSLVLVNDPAQRKLLSMSRDDFEQGWRAAGNWTLLAVPELQLASAAFRQENLSEARDHLSAALSVNPSSGYANEFLATVYYLQNNTEAALKYWNRAGQPVIDNIRIDPPVRTDPILLDRALGLSRGSFLSLADFETAEARLDSLHVFSRYRMELSPTDGERFDVTLRAAERDGANLWSWARGLPFETVTPRFSNIGGKAINVGTAFRWDSNKRRAFLDVEAPLRGDPKWGIHFRADGRDENWASDSGGFRMKRLETAVEIQAVPGARWRWTSGASVSSRRFSADMPGGIGLKYAGSVTRTLVREPARRILLDSTVKAEAGKVFRQDQPLRFGSLLNVTSFQWRSITTKVQLGRALGQLPFDELFMIGLDRDSDLWLRAHSAVVDGRKNASNMTRSFVVTNSDLQKTILNTGWLNVSAGPFVDSGKSSSGSRWMADAGAEVRVRILGSLGMSFSYGKSVTDGRQSFFARSQDR